MGCASIKLGFEQGELLGAELVAFGIRKQAIEAADDVAQMKRHRSNLRRASVQGFVTERSTPLFDVLARQLKGVDHSAQDGGNFGVGSTKPGFGHTGYGLQVTGDRCWVRTRDRRNSKAALTRFASDRAAEHHFLEDHMKVPHAIRAELRGVGPSATTGMVIALITGLLATPPFALNASAASSNAGFAAPCAGTGRRRCGGSG